MAGDVYVSFGAETGELEAGIAVAKAQVKTLAAEVRTLAGEMAKTGAAANSDLGQRLNDVATRLAQAKENVRGFSQELRGVGEAASESNFSQIREVLEGLTRPLYAVKNNLGEIAELFAGAFAVEKFVDLAKEMGELGESTERTAKTLGLSTEEVGRLNYQMALTGTNTERLDEIMGRFEIGLNQAATSGTGRVAEGLHALGLSAGELVNLGLPEQLQKIADAVASFQDSPTKTAALQALGRGFLELLPLLDEGSAKMRDLGDAADRTNSVLSETATAALVEMQHGFVDLGAAIKGVEESGFATLIPAVNGAVAILRDMAGAIAESIKTDGDWGAALSGLAYVLQQIEQFIAETVVGVRELNAAGEDLGARFEIIFGSLRDQLSHPFDFKAIGDDVKKQNDELLAEQSHYNDERLRIESDGQREYNSIWKAESEAKKAAAAPPKPTVGNVDESEIGKLKTQIDELTDSIQKAKAAAEGGINVPVSMGGGWNATQTPVTPGPGAFSMEKMAEFGRNAGFSGDSLATMVAIAQAESSGLAGAKNVNKNGTIDYGLTQINSGNDARLPGGARAALDPQTAFNDAFRLSKGGTNFQPWVTYQTGAYAQYMGQATAASSGGNVDAMQQQLTQAKTKLFELQQAQGGGSNADKAKLEIAEAEAKQNQNAVAVAEKEAAAKQKDVEAAKAAGIEQSKINQLEEQHAALAVKVREAKDAQAESAARLGIAQAKVTGDVKATYDAEMNLAKVKLQAAGADPTKQNEARAQMLAAEQTYNNAIRQQTMETARGEIEQAKQVAASERETLNERLKTHQINNAQWLAATKQALEQEAAAVRSAYAQELAIDNQTSAQKIKIAQEEQQRLAEISKEELKAQDQAAESTQKEWDQVAQSIMGAFNSALKGMLSGHESVRQAAAKLGEDLGMKLLDALEKKLIEGQLASFLSSLFGSFGGLGGLLAPAALVAADIGMWEVPQNQVAMIHKGELVMPPSEAGAFRSMLSGQAQSPGLAAGGGTHVGGDIHAHFHVPAMDSGDVKRFFANNSRHIMSALNGGIRNGDHVGLRNLGALK